MTAFPAESTRRGDGVSVRPPLWDLVRGSGLQPVVVGLSKDPNAKVTVLLVSPGSGRTRLAVKVPTTDGAAVAIEAELRALAEIRPLLPHELRDTLPRVVDVADYDGRPAVVASAVPGTPMTVAYMRRGHTRSRARVAGDLAAVDRWLSSFQDSTAAAGRSIDMDGGVTSRLGRRFADDPEVDWYLECLAEIHARLERETVPRTAVHGDLWFGNVLLGAGGVSGVVDWEAGSGAGEPVRDLVRFAVMYALYLDRRTRAGREVAGHPGLRAGSWGAALEFALDGMGWFPELFRRFLQTGLARLGAPPECWRDATLAGIAEVAALTDDPAFARQHLELFLRAVRRGGR